MMRQKVFHKAITDMDFDEPDGPSPSDMSFRLGFSMINSNCTQSFAHKGNRGTKTLTII